MSRTPAGFDFRAIQRSGRLWFARYADSPKVDFTVGNFYEQFGSGIVLRAYEEWALGIDNALMVFGYPASSRRNRGESVVWPAAFDFDSRLINGLGMCAP